MQKGGLREKPMRESEAQSAEDATESIALGAPRLGLLQKGGQQRVAIEGGAAMLLWGE